MALRSVLEDRLGQLDDTDFTAEALESAEMTMGDLGYTEIERWERTEVQVVDVDFIVGHVLSATSSDQILPTEREAFAEEVRTAIQAAAPADELFETVPVRAVLGRPTNATMPHDAGLRQCSGMTPDWCANDFACDV